MIFMSSLKCPKCGEEIGKSWKTCPYCGTEITNVIFEDYKTQIYSDFTPKETKTQIYSDVGKTNLNPETPVPQNNKGKIAAVAVVGVIILIAAVFAMMPNADKYYNEGVAFYNQEKYDEAIASFDKALEIDSNYAKSKEYLTHAWNHKGIALGEQGNYSNAITCFDKAIEIDPNYAEAWYRKGWAFFNLGARIEAQQYFDKAEQLDPSLKIDPILRNVVLP